MALQRKFETVQCCTKVGCGAITTQPMPACEAIWCETFHFCFFGTVQCSDNFQSDPKCTLSNFARSSNWDESQMQVWLGRAPEALFVMSFWGMPRNSLLLIGYFLWRLWQSNHQGVFLIRHKLYKSARNMFLFQLDIMFSLWTAR